MPLALLFDLDGTMVDTDHLHIAAWNAVLARDGRQIDAAFYRTRIMGFDNDAVTTALYPDHPASHRAATFGREGNSVPCDGWRSGTNRGLAGAARMG